MEEKKYIAKTFMACKVINIGSQRSFFKETTFVDRKAGRSLMATLLN